MITKVTMSQGHQVTSKTLGKLLIFLIFLFLPFVSEAKDIVILYTGDTHAMLYPCHCPIEPDGGIARRATLVKELRAKNNATLLLDSGAFFAGGLMDEYTLNTQLDIERAKVNLKAMEMMGYDAVNIGDDEFNFGREFFEKNAESLRFPLVSSNLESDKFRPFIIKDIAGVKVGIIGLTGVFAADKTGGIKVAEPKEALGKTIALLKKDNVDIIILLSHQGEEADLNLIKEIPGVDILIVGHSRSKEEASSKIGSVLVLRPAWQGRRLGKVTLTIKDKKISNYKAEEIRISDKIKDDAQVLSVLPRCFADSNCKKQGMAGLCQEPGTMNARCLFTEVTKVNLTVISSKDCRVCNTDQIIEFLKKQFPGLEPAYLYYPEQQAAKLVKELGIKTLPLYLLGKEIEREKNFQGFSKNLEPKGNYYQLKEELSGVSYYLERPKMAGKLDLFISLFDKDIADLLEVTKEYKPAIHFLATENQGGFEAAKGNLETEEYLRAVCVSKIYPDKYKDYLSCRAKKINSSWWEDCAAGMDIARIKFCAQGKEGMDLLKENISLNKEIKAMFGPAYLMDNQQIFMTQGTPAKEDLRKILKK